MSMVRVHHFAISLDGYGTGEGQGPEAPFGHAGTSLTEWFFSTRLGRGVHGDSGGVRGVDDALAEQWLPGVGAEIMGRNKFGPQRGPWTDHEWQGWWGDEPPFRTPVVVLTHHPRPVIEFDNGTSFHFVDAGPTEALRIARELAAERGSGPDIRIGGGPTTTRAFLEADLVDHLHLVVVPIVLGRGERLWSSGLEGLQEHFGHVETVSSPSGAVHVIFTRTPRS